MVQTNCLLLFIRKNNRIIICCQHFINLLTYLCKCQAFFTIFSQYFYCILVYYKCSLLCDLKPVFCWYCSKIHIELQHKKTGICQSFKIIIQLHLFRLTASFPQEIIVWMIYSQTYGVDNFPAISAHLLSLFLSYYQN